MFFFGPESPDIIITDPPVAISAQDCKHLKKTTDPPGPDPVEGDPDHGRGVGEGLARPGGDRGGIDPRRRDLLERTAWVRVGPL